MPYHTSPKKRLRRDTRVRQENHSKVQRLRTFLKKARQVLSDPVADLSETQKVIQSTQSALSKAASKGLIHRKSAARRVSRLMKRITPKVVL